MNAPAAMTDHVNHNELAALVEHGPEGVDPSVVEHVADCGECREALMTASDVRQEMEAEQNVEHGDFSRGRGSWKVLASAAALAAALFIVFGAPLRERWFGPKGTEALAEASRTVEQRATEGRLSGFPFQPRTVMRSGNTEEDIDLNHYRVLQEVGKIQSNPKSSPHAVGVAQLLASPNPGVVTRKGEAIVALEKALATATPEERSAVANDLGVALIARGGDADVARALTLMEEQWRTNKTPEIAWNRALALERLERNKEAIQAWNDYLALDPSSPWAAEVKSRHLAILELDS